MYMISLTLSEITVRPDWSVTVASLPGFSLLLASLEAKKFAVVLNGKRLISWYCLKMPPSCLGKVFSFVWSVYVAVLVIWPSFSWLERGASRDESTSDCLWSMCCRSVSLSSTFLCTSFASPSKVDPASLPSSSVGTGLLTMIYGMLTCKASSADPSPLETSSVSWDAWDTTSVAGDPAGNTMSSSNRPTWPSNAVASVSFEFCDSSWVTGDSARLSS